LKSNVFSLWKEYPQLKKVRETQMEYKVPTLTPVVPMKPGEGLGAGTATNELTSSSGTDTAANKKNMDKSNKKPPPPGSEQGVPTTKKAPAQAAAARAPPATAGLSPATAAAGLSATAAAGLSAAAVPPLEENDRPWSLTPRPEEIEFAKRLALAHTWEAAAREENRRKEARKANRQHVSLLEVGDMSDDEVDLDPPFI
jgi:hypothetical protein